MHGFKRNSESYEKQNVALQIADLRGCLHKTEKNLFYIFVLWYNLFICNVGVLSIELEVVGVEWITNHHLKRLNKP